MLVFSLAGYDRDTERLAVEYDIPMPIAAMAMQVAGIDLGHKRPHGNYPLNQTRASYIAELIGHATNHRYDYFFKISAADEKAIA
jgi:hypothetical protein